MSTSQRAVMPCGWGVKAGMVRVLVAGKTVWSPCYTRAMSERFRDKEFLYNKRYINSPSLLYFTFTWDYSLLDLRVYDTHLQFQCHRQTKRHACIFMYFSYVHSCRYVNRLKSYGRRSRFLCPRSVAFVDFQPSAMRARTLNKIRVLYVRANVNSQKNINCLRTVMTIDYFSV